MRQPPARVSIRIVRTSFKRETAAVFRGNERQPRRFASSKQQRCCFAAVRYVRRRAPSIEPQRLRCGHVPSIH